MSEAGGGTRRKTFALVLLCCASFVAVLDLTIVAIALPSVRRELGFGGGDVQWILTGYALSFGGLLLFMGRAGDLYGRRRLRHRTPPPSWEVSVGGSGLPQPTPRWPWCSFACVPDRERRRGPRLRQPNVR
ncbi:MAG TPA: MFS transporter [Rubrobacter sp.]|nr:MFS transporter [Rubrobacter sp.]